MSGSRSKVIKRWMQKVAIVLELVLSVFVAVVLFILVFRMIVTIPMEAAEGMSGVQKLLEEALEIAIGVEFIKMLCLHTPGTVLEVLLFAIARHLIVKEPTAVETLLGILTIAILFAIHKYLLVSHKELEHMSFKASTTIGFVNLTSDIYIHENSDVLIGDFLKEILMDQGKEIKVGATAYLKSYLLRVEKMNGDEISRVELVYKE